jgi:hypothetical protein
MALTSVTKTQHMDLTSVKKTGGQVGLHIEKKEAKKEKQVQDDDAVYWADKYRCKDYNAENTCTAIRYSD